MLQYAGAALLERHSIDQCVAELLLWLQVPSLWGVKQSGLLSSSTRVGTYSWPGQDIFVQTVYGSLHHISVAPHAGLDAFKKQVADVTSIPEEQQKLVWNGSELQEVTALLSRSSIVEVIVHVAPRCQGGGKGESSQSRIDLTQDDVLTFISWSQSSQLEISQSAVRGNDNGLDVVSQYDTVPQLIIAMLLSLTASAAQLHRILQQQWMSTWDGFARAQSMLERTDDAALQQAICTDCVQELARISLQNVNLVGKSDTVRKLELAVQGRFVGLGHVHGEQGACEGLVCRMHVCFPMPHCQVCLLPLLSRFFLSPQTFQTF